jgi:RND family efflux transporter MFP subunit
VLAPLAVLGLGALVAVTLARTGPEQETRDPERVAPLVRAVQVQSQSLRLQVKTQGTVEPRTESALVPEVSGPVVWVSPSFRSGAYFDESQILLRIDARDYHVAFERAQAGLERAESQWKRDHNELERRKKLAERDYASPAQLDAAETQERVSHAALRETRAALDQAERDMARTEVRAPYTGRVRATTVDVGQFVNRGAAIATLYATDYAEVRLPIPDDDLAYLDLPLWHRDDETAEGPEVLLSARFAGGQHTWRGQVVRTEGEIDARSRMVHVVARVEDPYAASDGRPPLAVGLFVEAQIQGRQAEGVYVVPRAALRQADTLYVIDAEDRLRIRSVEVLRSTREQVVVGAGLSDGDRVVVSPFDAAVDGMQVRAMLESDPS